MDMSTFSESKVQLGFRFAIPGLAFIAALFLTGCETTQIAAQLPPPPQATVGPKFTVLNAPRYKYVINAVTDDTGRAHIIYAYGQEVVHAVIGPEGVESREVIRSNYMPKMSGVAHPKEVDLAFDRAGTLHALIDNEHLIRKEGMWVGGQRTPWGDAHVQPRNLWPGDIAFVKGTPDLTWAFYLPGTAVGLSSTVLLTGAGGGLPVPTPKSEDIWRLAVVPEEKPYLHWHVLGMDADNFSYMQILAGNQNGNIYSLYYMYYIGLRRSAFHTTAKCKEPVACMWFSQKPLELTDGTPVCAVAGDPVTTMPPEGVEAVQSCVGMDYTFDALGPHLAFAIDGNTGATLAASQDTGTSLVIDKNASHGARRAMPITNAGLVLQPAGNGRFHALAVAVKHIDWTPPVYYLAYSNGAWSAPIEVGKYADNVWGGVGTSPDEPWTDVFKIVAGKNGRALILWPTDAALVGRWVTLK